MRVGKRRRSSKQFLCKGENKFIEIRNLEVLPDSAIADEPARIEDVTEGSGLERFQVCDIQTWCPKYEQTRREPNGHQARA